MCREREVLGARLCSLTTMTDPLFVLDPNRDDTPLAAALTGDITDDALEVGWNLTLPDHICRHAIQSMRLGDGDTMQLSDGKGLRVHAQLVDARNGVAQVRSFIREPQPVTRLTLIQALAKTGHDEQAIDMATQVGVDSVIPWQAERSIAKWKTGRTDRKWHGTLESATQQSRRAWMPQLEPCVSDKQIVAICRRACVHGDIVIALHQDATTTWSALEQSVEQLSQRTLDDGRSRSISVIVGPEGGISDDEIALFTGAGAQSCVLGATIMRASTAGPVALSLLARALGRFA